MVFDHIPFSFSRTSCVRCQNASTLAQVGEHVPPEHEHVSIPKLASEHHKSHRPVSIALDSLAPLIISCKSVPISPSGKGQDFGIGSVLVSVLQDVVACR